MPDLIALVTTALLFPLAVLYVSGCETLKSSRTKGIQS